jgi:lipid-A-disaccharide synthase
MKPPQIMIIAGEPSGDALAAELVRALRVELVTRGESNADPQPLRTGLEPRFFGAGGPNMKAEGVELVLDMTEHSMLGIAGVQSYFKFRGFLSQLLQLAVDRQPDAVVCVDFGAFNRQFAHGIRQREASRGAWFHNWRPKLIQYVSPQVWASRESRAWKIAKAYDLLLSIFPFEPAWYAKRVPSFPVEFVGHPVVDRYRETLARAQANPAAHAKASPTLLLLPGSRPAELDRHLPVMIRAWELMRVELPSLDLRIVLPNETIVSKIKSMNLPEEAEIQTGEISEALLGADVAITKTGTVTMECAFFGVPAVTLFRTSLLNFEIGKRIVKIKTLTMPNLLAGEEVYPEFLQSAATPRNLSRAALELLRDEPRRQRIKARLSEITASLGGPGASRRAAKAIAREVRSKN